MGRDYILCEFCFVGISICGKFAYEMKITKAKYLTSFLSVTLVLALVRCAFPSIAGDKEIDTGDNYSEMNLSACNDSKSQCEENENSVSEHSDVQNIAKFNSSDTAVVQSRFFNADGSLVKNRIYSVPGFSLSFPDQNDVQLRAAQEYGVKPVLNREDAEKRKSELVYVGSNMYFYVDHLRNSIPYLVPKASALLQDVGRSFFDSLQLKGIPLHKIIVTSVLRSKADVESLRGKNSNATQNSCHLYGTTFDVCYNRYKTVEAPGERRRAVRNDTLKWVLAEVLRDMRESGRCYVKYEVHQGCFHITVK